MRIEMRTPRATQIQQGAATGVLNYLKGFKGRVDFANPAVMHLNAFCFKQAFGFIG